MVELLLKKEGKLEAIHLEGQDNEHKNLPEKKQEIVKTALEKLVPLPIGSFGSHLQVMRYSLFVGKGSGRSYAWLPERQLPNPHRLNKCYCRLPSHWNVSASNRWCMMTCRRWTMMFFAGGSRRTTLPLAKPRLSSQETVYAPELLIC